MISYQRKVYSFGGAYEKNTRFNNLITFEKSKTNDAIEDEQKILRIKNMRRETLRTSILNTINRIKLKKKLKENKKIQKYIDEIEKIKNRRKEEIQEETSLSKKYYIKYDNWKTLEKIFNNYSELKKKKNDKISRIENKIKKILINEKKLNSTLTNTIKRRENMETLNINFKITEKEFEKSNLNKARLFNMLKNEELKLEEYRTNKNLYSIKKKEMEVLKTKLNSKLMNNRDNKKRYLKKLKDLKDKKVLNEKNFERIKSEYELNEIIIKNMSSIILVIENENQTISENFDKKSSQLKNFDFEKEKEALIIKYKKINEVNRKLETFQNLILEKLHEVLPNEKEEDGKFKMKSEYDAEKDFESIEELLKNERVNLDKDVRMFQAKLIELQNNHTDHSLKLHKLKLEQITKNGFIIKINEEIQKISDKIKETSIKVNKTDSLENEINQSITELKTKVKK
jgi:DNA repair protein SbcC/Rad50